MAVSYTHLVQHGRHLLPGDGAVGGEGGGAGAVDNVVGRCPGNGIGIPGAARHVGEGAAAGHRGLVLQPVEDLSLIHISWQKVSDPLK